MHAIRREIVSRGLQKLTEFGKSFSISVSMERDDEDENWSYEFISYIIHFSNWVRNPYMIKWNRNARHESIAIV